MTAHAKKNRWITCATMALLSTFCSSCGKSESKVQQIVASIEVIGPEPQLSEPEEIHKLIRAARLIECSSDSDVKKAYSIILDKHNNSSVKWYMATNKFNYINRILYDVPERVAYPVVVKGNRVAFDAPKGKVPFHIGLDEPMREREEYIRDYEKRNLSLLEYQ